MNERCEDKRLEMVMRNNGKLLVGSGPHDLIPLWSISRPLIPSTPTTNLPTSSCSWWCSQWRWHSHRPHDHLHDGPTTDAMTDPLTAKTEPMSDPISESLTNPMRDPRTSLKTDPKADCLTGSIDNTQIKTLTLIMTKSGKLWLQGSFIILILYTITLFLFSPSNYFATFMSPKWLFSLWPFQWKVSTQRIKPMNILGHTGWDLSSLAPTREAPPATSTALCLAWHSQCTLPSK